MGRGTTKSNAARLDTAKKRAQVLELATAGFSFREIATKVGYAGPSGAYRAFQSGLRQIVQPRAEEYLQLEIARIDELVSVLWPLGKSGDLKAIDRLLKLMKRRAELLGLDAPQRVTAEVETTSQISTGPTIAELAELTDDPKGFREAYYQALSRQYGERLPYVVDEGQTLGGS